VFGNYIDIYDLTRAVDDGATVPVYFEPRLIKVALSAEMTEELLDLAADEATAGLDDAERARIEQSVAVVNAVYGSPQRIAALAVDIVDHWERRRAQLTKYIESPGKAMIVGATREICANLYAAIIKLRPDWHSDELAGGRIKVVYSGSASDTPPISEHVRRDSQNASIKKRLTDPDDDLEIVIVKDMMLTGYDSPPLHTLYLDRLTQGRVAHADAGPGEPHLQGQAGRAAGRVRAARRQPPEGRSPNTRPPTRSRSRSGRTSTRPSDSRPHFSK